MQDLDQAVPLATWMCSDDAQTRAEGIFEVSTRRDCGYTLHGFGKSMVL